MSKSTKKPNTKKADEKEQPEVNAKKTEEKPEAEAKKAEEKPEADAKKTEEKPEAEAKKAEEKPEAEAKKAEEKPEAEAKKAEEKPEADAKKDEEKKSGSAAKKSGNGANKSNGKKSGTKAKKETKKSEPEVPRNVRVSVSTSVGCVRERNEDNFFADEFGVRLEEEEAFTGELDLNCRRIFAVCDGMGGEDFGDDASEISSGVIVFYKGQMREAKQEELHSVVNSYAIKANNEIWEMVRRQDGYQSGSTMAMVIIDKENVNVFNIGDSRVYFYKNKKLEQITEDQTLAMKKYKENIYTLEQAKSGPDCHRITNFIGIDERGMGPQSVHTGVFPYEPMMILICSDGLSDMCSDEEIADVLSEKMENHADALVDKALCNGGVDNVTCVVISI